MNISALRHQVRFYNRVTIPGSYGGSSKYVGAFTEWADVRSLPGEEFRSTVFTISKTPYRVFLRYREGITAIMKLKNLTDGMVMDIEAVRDPDGKRETLELLCSWSDLYQTPLED